MTLAVTPAGIEAAIYAGAFDDLLKPFETERDRLVVERALEKASWSRPRPPPLGSSTFR